MAIKVDEHLSAACADLSKMIHSPAFGYAVARVARKGMEKYVPLDTGRLRDTATIEPCVIHYNAPYAYYPWSGNYGHIRTDKNPTATAHWPKVYMTNNGKDFERAVGALIDKGGF